jgi:hypothetical protein
MNTLFLSFLILLLCLIILIILRQTDSSEEQKAQQQGALPATCNGNGCINYDSIRLLIMVLCKSASLRYTISWTIQVSNKEPQQKGRRLLNAFYKQTTHSDYSSRRHDVAQDNCRWKHSCIWNSCIRQFKVKFCQINILESTDKLLCNEERIKRKVRTS